MAQEPHNDGPMQMPAMAQNAAAAATNLQMQQLHMQQQQHLQQQQLQLQRFWADQMTEIREIDPDKADFKVHELPLARIKKIMKIEDEIKAEMGGHRFMISAEAPVIFAKACEMFILEVTLRAWAHTEENKRRTLQKNDISMAVSKTDQYDFLIDIVPRDDVKPHKKEELGRLPLVDPQLLFMQPQMAMLPPGMQIQDAQQLQLLQQQQLQPQMMWGQQPGMYYSSQGSHGQEYPPQGFDPSVLMGMPGGASMGEVQGQGTMSGMHGSSHYGEPSSMPQMGMLPPMSMHSHGAHGHAHGHGHGHHMSSASGTGAGASMGSSSNMGGNM